jgi:hypothetical protein
LAVMGETYRTQSHPIQVQCIADQTCDVQGGENFLTCPEDCLTGLADGICDSVNDGRIDPDCLEGIDPDSEGEMVMPEASATVQETPEAPTPVPIWILLGGIGLLVCVAVLMFILALRTSRRG